MSDLRMGDIIQLRPAPPSDPMFGGALAIVEQVREWGVMAYVPVPMERGAAPGRVYGRFLYGTFERIGPAPWVPADLIDEG